MKSNFFNAKEQEILISNDSVHFTQDQDKYNFYFYFTVIILDNSQKIIRQ